MNKHAHLFIFFIGTLLFFLISCSNPAVYYNDSPSITSSNASGRSITYVEGDRIWMEAEAGAEHNPMIVKSDQSASGQIYLASWSSDTSLDSAPSDGNIIYNFSTPQGGSYRLWIRVKTPDTSSNSYWLKMNSGSWTVWEDITVLQDNPWHWAGFNTTFDLAAGDNELTIAYREANTALDKILITGNLSYIPSGAGKDIPLPSGSVAAYSNVVEQYGRLQVSGTQLCDQNGNQVQLKGLSTHGIQWFPVYKDHTIPNLVNSWGIDIIRIAMYVEDWYEGDDFWNGYLAHPDEMKQWTMDLVDDAIEAGIYVIVDWHIHNDPSNFTEQAKTFFNEMSAIYAAYPNVMYEICNEIIGGVSWSTVKTYAEAVIPEIRANDPDNIIIIGTPNWSQYVDEAANDPVTGYDNLMYALHFYAASHKQSYVDRAEDALFGTNDMGNNPNHNQIPLIATEWGTCDYDASYNDFDWSEIWIDFLDENLISWCNWSFSSKDEASSILKPYVDTIGPWYETGSPHPHTDGCDYTESGLWVKERMAREPQQVYQLGDVNHDGVINIVDALLVSQYYVGYDIKVYFDPTLADVNKDGAIDNVDALLIAQYYSGLIASF
jgi:hypothetical protein